MVFCITILIFGVMGNTMVPFVLIRSKEMRNSTNYFLTNLSIADLLVLLICTPTVLVEVNTKPETWILGYEMCIAVPFVELTVAHASVLTILAISFERYYAICEPLKAGYVCTKTRAMLICLGSWLAAAFFASPMLLMAEYEQKKYVDGTDVNVCYTRAATTWTVLFFLATIAGFFLIPLLILITLYSMIAKNLVRKNPTTTCKIRPSKQEQNLKARQQVVLMLGTVVLSFFLCLLPFRILTLAIIISDEIFDNIKLDTYYIILFFCRIMLYLNSAINPILYNLMSSKFRRGFRSLYCYLCCRQVYEHEQYHNHNNRYYHHHRRQEIENRRSRISVLNTTATTTSSFLSSSSSNSKRSHRQLSSEKITNLKSEETIT